MKTNITKIFSLTVAAAITTSCASCSMIPGMGSSAKTEDIVDAADAFASALVKCDAGKIIKLTNEEKDSDAAEDLEVLFGNEDYTDEQIAIADAVADTIEYEIDEESVKIDKDEASVDVTFTMADYEAVLEGEFSDSDEAVAAISDCDDTAEVEVTFEFALEDDEWLISNLGDKAYSKLYGFYGLDVSFMPDLAALVDYTDIYADYNYVYLSIVFTENVSDYIDDMTFDVFLDGELLYGDQTPYGDGDYIWCDLTIDGPLESGTYTVTCYYGDTVIASDYIDVDNSGSTVISGDPTDAEGDVYLCEMEFGEYLEEFLVDSGYDIDFEGQLTVWLELTLYDDGTYKIAPDLVNFEANLEEYMTNNMTDENLIAFSGYSSMAEVEEYADSNEISVDTLKELIIDSMVSSSIANVAEESDQGTYLVSGDSISFDSSIVSDFEGTIGDGNMISFVHEYFSPATDYVLEFYPEG